MIDRMNEGRRNERMSIQMCSEKLEKEETLFRVGGVGRKGSIKKP